MQNIRTMLDAPSLSDVVGATRFVGSMMRPAVFRHGQAAQVAGFGNITAVETTYQILPSDGLVTCGTTNSYTVTLPAFADVLKGHVVYVKKTGASGTLTIDGSGSETIDGAANVQTATENDLVAVVYDGTEWARINLAGTAGVSALTVTTQTTTANVDATDDLTVDTGTSDHTLTLPAVSGLTGVVLRFKKTGVSGVVTVDGNGAETIDGAANFTLTEQYESATIVCNGTTWFRLDNTPVLRTQTVTGADTVLPNTDVVLVTSDTAFSLALPTPANRGTGKTLVIKKAVGTGSNACTLTTPGAETVDGAASYAVTEAYRSVTLFSDGTNWHVLNSDTPAASA